MRLLLATLVASLVAACSAPQSSPGETPQAAPEGDSAIANDGGEAAPEPTIEDMRAESLKAIDRPACEAAGGEVRQEGMLGMWRCVKPYADAGAPCSGKADCEGKCLAVDGAMHGEEAVGACQANDSPFGCYAEVEGGKVQGGICVD